MGFAVLFERSGESVDEGRVRRMVTRSTLAEPTREGISARGVIGLGQAGVHVAPSRVCDLPHRDERARCAIVASLRLHHIEDLAHRLDMPADAPEEALVLGAYLRFGPDVVHHLRGEFALAVWDERARSVFVARDALGMRPVYYHVDPHSFRCASRMPALFADDRLQPKPDLHQVGAFLIDQYAETDATLWRGVRAVPAGGAMLVDPARVRTWRHWRPDSRRRRSASSAQCAEELRETLSDAVERDMQADGPVYVNVSGGLDSSTIAAMAVHASKQEGAVELVTLGLAGVEGDETAWAAQVAAHLERPLTVVGLDEQGPWLEPRPAKLGAGAYYHPTVEMHGAVLARMRRQGSRVVLTGLGGDELLHDTGEQLSDALARGQVRSALSLAGVSGQPTSAEAWKRLLKLGARQLLPSDLQAWARRWRGRPRSFFPNLEPWLADELYLALVERPNAFPEAPSLEQKRLCEVLMVAPQTRLPLVRVEHLAAAHGMEVRHPFWTVEVMDLLLALPDSERYRPDELKPVLREAARGLLPESVRLLDKDTSFDGYVDRCLRVQYRGLLEQYLGESLLEAVGVLRPGAASELLRGPELHPMLVSAVAMELWLRDPPKP